MKVNENDDQRSLQDLGLQPRYISLILENISIIFLDHFLNQLSGFHIELTNQPSTTQLHVANLQLL